MAMHGKVTVPLTPGGEKGWCYFSPLIPLEIKEDEVFIDLALENADGSVCFGSSAPFEDCDFLDEPLSADLGAVLSADKASFRVGIRLNADTERTEAVVFWRVCALSDEGPSKDHRGSLVDRTFPDQAQVHVAAPAEFYIEAAPSYMRPGDRFMFSCHRPEGHSDPVEWSVKGEQAGRINGYGMYTAPDHGGVFEVEARLGAMTARAYVMVREET